MIERVAGRVHYFTFENLSRFRNLVTFVSTRKGGVSKAPYDELNMSFDVGDDPSAVLENRKSFFGALEIPLDSCVFCEQIHGSKIAVVDSSMAGRGVFSIDGEIRGVDGLVTSTKEICLIVRTADCLPIVLYDPERSVLGVLHVGWRGTLGQIAGSAIDFFKSNYNSKPQNIFVGVGPSIGPDDYRVRSDVADRFIRAGVDEKNLVRVSPNQWKLNLLAINVNQMRKRRVPEENIGLAGISTFSSNETFFSYRKSRPTGHFVTGAMMK